MPFQQRHLRQIQRHTMPVPDVQHRARQFTPQQLPRFNHFRFPTNFEMASAILPFLTLYLTKGKIRPVTVNLATCREQVMRVVMKRAEGLIHPPASCSTGLPLNGLPSAFTQ